MEGFKNDVSTEPTKSALVINVGNRDVWLNVAIASDDHAASFVPLDRDPRHIDAVRGALGGKAAPNELGARAFGRIILQNYDNYADRLAFPIIKPALDMALFQIGNRQPASLDKVVLIATDQLEQQGSHHLWDTVEIARVIQHWISISKEYRDRVHSVELRCITRYPNKADAAYRFIRRVLLSDVQTSSYRDVFIGIRGGIPAMNAALRELTIWIYGPKASIIEVEEPAPEAASHGEPGTVRLVPTWPFRRDTIRRLVGELLKHEAYDAIRSVLRAEDVLSDAFDKALDSEPKQILALLEGYAPATDPIERSVGEGEGDDANNAGLRQPTQGAQDRYKRAVHAACQLRKTLESSGIATAVSGSTAAGLYNALDHGPNDLDVYVFGPEGREKEGVANDILNRLVETTHVQRPGGRLIQNDVMRLDNVQLLDDERWRIDFCFPDPQLQKNARRRLQLGWYEDDWLPVIGLEDLVLVKLAMSVRDADDRVLEEILRQHAPIIELDWVRQQLVAIFDDDTAAVTKLETLLTQIGHQGGT